MFFKYYFTFKSLKCNRKAFTEILISQNESPNEINKLNNDNPKRYMPVICCPTKRSSIAKTDRNKHITPNNCIYRIRVQRKFNFLISNKIIFL